MIIKKPLFLEILILSVVIALMHQAALSFYLYWTTGWFDIVMHFLGGLLMGLIALFIFVTSHLIHIPKDHKLTVALITLGFVLVVGLVWELWELFVGFTDVLEDQVDTVLDIVMDMLGAGAALWYFNIKDKFSLETNE